MTKTAKAALFTAAGMILGCSRSSAKSVSLGSDEQKASYAIGQRIGRQMKAQGVKIDPDVFAASVGDALEGRESRMSPGDMDAAVQKMEAKMQMDQQAKSAGNKAQGEAYLKANKDKAGVKTTASGLEYEVLSEGKGPKPKAASTVRVHYRGTLIDGTEFDSSYKRNAPAEFPLNRVIKGWTEGVQLMPVGSKFRFVIPSALAYGENSPPGIPPSSVLVFEVELLAILK